MKTTINYLNENGITLVTADEAARIADEYAVTPEFLRTVIREITNAYEHGFKEISGQYYDNTHEKDLLYKAARDVNEYLKEHEYFADIKITDMGIMYYVRWSRTVTDISQQNQ